MYEYGCNFTHISFIRNFFWWLSRKCVEMHIKHPKNDDRWEGAILDFEFTCCKI